MLRTLEEVCEIIIKMEFSSLDKITDVLMFIKQWCLREKKIPQQLMDAFSQGEAGLSSHDSMIRLKVIL